MLPTNCTISGDNHHHNNSHYIVTTTTKDADVEEGIIEIPLAIEEGVEIPLDAFEKLDNDSSRLPSTPTTISPTSSDDDGALFVQDAADDSDTKSKKCWTPNHIHLVLAGTIIVLVSSAAFFFSSLHLASRRQQQYVQRIGNNGSPNNVFPLTECKGDCDNDQECDQGLVCYQRYASYEAVPGCLGGEEDGRETDYCVRPVNDRKKNDNDDGDKQPPENTIETATITTSGSHPIMNSPSSASTTTTAEEQSTLPPSPSDKFLLSGQSNMVGHTTSGQSVTSNGDYWNKIKSILEQGGNLNTMEEELYNVIYEANYYEYSTIELTEEQAGVARTLANGVMDLYKSELLNDLDAPLQFGKCSFKELDDSNVYDVSQGTVPIVWNANCGHSFGHELLFARTMELAMNYTTEFEMYKVARGGSGLYEHWYPNHGRHWNILKKAIRKRQGQGDWKGFIWHQGSQASWSVEQYGEDRSLTYYGNLTGLVNEVRELMFQNSISWQCKEEIPVVIVQLGFWPDNAKATIVRDAQARFCDEDPRAVLVKTDDLARNYHYDAASFLISGNRIAHAYQEALRGVVQCPDRVPSGSPSESIKPSKSMEPTVMRLETDLPSSINTTELV
ncbi:hypothetical protein ACHAWT_001093 [Skeletonema menzelii]